MHRIVNSGWYLIALTALMLVLGCDKRETSQQSLKTQDEGPKEKKALVVGFSQTGAESSWRIAHTKSVKEEAAKRNIELLFADGQNVHNNQVNAVNGFITKGVDVIVIAPQESIGWKPTLKEAKRAGIPVVLTSRGVDADEDLYETVLVADFVWEGKQAGEWLATERCGANGARRRKKTAYESSLSPDFSAAFTKIMSALIAVLNLYCSISSLTFLMVLWSIFSITSGLKGLP